MDLEALERIFPFLEDQHLREAGCEVVPASFHFSPEQPETLAQCPLVAGTVHLGAVFRVEEKGARHFGRSVGPEFSFLTLLDALATARSRLTDDQSHVRDLCPPRKLF